MNLFACEVRYSENYSYFSIADLNLNYVLSCAINDNFDSKDTTATVYEIYTDYESDDMEDTVQAINENETDVIILAKIIEIAPKILQFNDRERVQAIIKILDKRAENIKQEFQKFTEKTGFFPSMMIFQ